MGAYFLLCFAFIIFVVFYPLFCAVMWIFYHRNGGRKSFLKYMRDCM